jgi:glycosyltransferase involved in cell wall biosynthesis
MQFRPHVVHAFKPKGPSGLVSLIVRLKVPLVVDMDDWEGRGGWNDRLPYPLWQKLLFSWQEKSLPPRAGSVTVASRHLATLSWSLGVEPQATFYLPNGLSLARWESFGAVPRAGLRGHLGLPEGPLLLLYTRFAEFHPERPLQVLAGVLRLHPNAKMLVVGVGLRGEEKTLRQAAAKLGLSHALLEVGWVSREQVPLYLRAADLALLPMDDDLINRTKCPAKLVDLMAAGLPIVADAVGEATEYLQGAGRLVPPGDVEAMASAAAELLASPDRARRLGRAARERIRRHYLWEHLATTAEKAYLAATALRP